MESMFASRKNGPKQHGFNQLSCQIDKFNLVRSLID